MTLSEWRDRLQLMARSSICHLEPHEAADLVKAIDEWLMKPLSENQRKAIKGRLYFNATDGEPDEALPERKADDEVAW